MATVKSGTEEKKVVLRVDAGRATTNVALPKNGVVRAEEVVTISSFVKQVMGNEHPDTIEGDTVITIGSVSYLIGESARKEGARYSEVSEQHGFHGRTVLPLIFYGITKLFKDGGKLDLALEYSIEHSAYENAAIKAQIKADLGTSHSFTAVREDTETEYNVSFTVKFASQADAALRFFTTEISNKTGSGLLIGRADTIALEKRKITYPIDTSSLLVLEIGSNNTILVRYDNKTGRTLYAESVWGINNVRARTNTMLQKAGIEPTADHLIAEYAANPDSAVLKNSYGEAVLKKYKAILLDTMTEAFSAARKKLGNTPATATYTALTGGGAHIMKDIIQEVGYDVVNIGKAVSVKPFGNGGFVRLVNPHLSVILGMKGVK